MELTLKTNHSQLRNIAHGLQILYHETEKNLKATKLVEEQTISSFEQQTENKNSINMQQYFYEKLKEVKEQLKEINLILTAPENNG